MQVCWGQIWTLFLPEVLDSCCSSSPLSPQVYRLPCLLFLSAADESSSGQLKRTRGDWDVSALCSALTHFVCKWRPPHLTRLAPPCRRDAIMTITMLSRLSASKREYHHSVSWGAFQSAVGETEREERTNSLRTTWSLQLKASSLKSHIPTKLAAFLEHSI